MRSRSEAFFHDIAHSARPSRRFCIWHAAEAPPAVLVVHVHAFAEEMNKARRMVALQSRDLAESGAAVLQMDLLGCGDSDADFADATWHSWLDDVAAAHRLARQKHAQSWPGVPLPPLWLWGLRAGCLLVAQAAERLNAPCNLLFWQPALSGKVALQQFLRLKLASAMVQPDSQAVAQHLRSELAAGRPVEIAGYRLSPNLASGMEQAQLLAPTHPGRLIWLETSPHEDLTLPPPSQQVVGRWQATGHDVKVKVVAGPAFWSTVEIEDAPALVQATTRMLLPLPPS